MRPQLIADKEVKTLTLTVDHECGMSKEDLINQLGAFMLPSANCTP